MTEMNVRYAIGHTLKILTNQAFAPKPSLGQSLPTFSSPLLFTYSISSESFSNIMK